MLRVLLQKITLRDWSHTEQGVELVVLSGCRESTARVDLGVDRIREGQIPVPFSEDRRKPG